MQSLTTVPRNPPLDASIARAVLRSNLSAPLVLKLLAVAILLPEEIAFFFQGLRFSIARVILFALTPVVLMRIGRMFAIGRYRFVLSDLFVPATGLWMFVAFGVTGGVQDALNHAGPIALEFCVGYLAARVLLSEHGQAVAFINFQCWAIAIVALLGLLDTLTHRLFVHDLIHPLLGGNIYGDAGGRFGLERAVSTYEQPIIYGVTCSIGMLLAASVPMRGRRFIVFSCGLGTLLSLSSGPILGAIVGFGLLTYDRVLASVPRRWAGLIFLMTAGIVMVFLLVERPFSFIFNHIVFDTETAYYRYWTWQVSTDALAGSPWFGLGFVFPDFYEIPHSVDSVWLYWALLYGVPAPLLLALSIVGATSLPTNGRRVGLATAESKLGTTLGILFAVIVFLGFTVDFFGTEWILIPLLAGVRAHLGELGRVYSPA